MRTDGCVYGLCGDTSRVEVCVGRPQCIDRKEYGKKKQIVLFIYPAKPLWNTRCLAV